MPQIIRSVDEIMKEAGHDVAFVGFGSPFERTEASRAAKRRHLAWFRERGIRTETAAPRGWLEGDPDLVAVHFGGTDDPRLAEYAGEFEDQERRSREPDAYQMVILLYDGWARSYDASLAAGGDEEGDA